MKTLTFSKYNAYSYSYDVDGYPSLRDKCFLCSHFVNDYLKIPSEILKIAVKVSSKRVHSKGWMKIQSMGYARCPLVNGKELLEYSMRWHTGLNASLAFFGIPNDVPIYVQITPA